MPKSTLRPINRTANATEIRFNAPRAKIAKAAVQIRPISNVTSAAAASLSDRNPISNRTTTRNSDTPPATPMPFSTLCSSSWASAAEPVRRTRTPFSRVRPRSRAAARTPFMAFAAGCKDLKSRAGWRTRTRRLAKTSSSGATEPVINVCQDNCLNFPAFWASATSARASSTVINSKGASAGSLRNSSMARSSMRNRPTRLGSRQRVPRKGCASASRSLSS